MVTNAQRTDNVPGASAHTECIKKYVPAQNSGTREIYEQLPYSSLCFALPCFAFKWICIAISAAGVIPDILDA